MRVARVNGIGIHYREQGNPAGPVLVFSNSLGTDMRIWDEVLTALTADFRVITYDKRGHGLTECTAAPYSIEQHAADLEELLDHLGCGEVTLCGLSVGGMIAQFLAHRRPDMIRRLILADTAHRIGPPDMWQQRIDTVTSRGIETIADSILERWFSSRYRATRPELSAWRAMLTRTAVEGYAGTCAAIRDADLADIAKRIAVPTLCLYGDEDSATPPELVRALAGLIEGEAYREIKGAGHLPCVEAPQQVSSLIAEFLKETNIVG